MLVDRSTLVAAVSLAQLYHKTYCKLPGLEISGLASTSTWCHGFGGKAHKEAVVSPVSLLLYSSVVCWSMLYQLQVHAAGLLCVLNNGNYKSSPLHTCISWLFSTHIIFMRYFVVWSYTGCHLQSIR